MATFSKVKLTASTSGKGIVLADSTTAIHTAIAGSEDIDEIWLYATNVHSASVLLTIEHGSTDTGDNIVITIPAQAGLFCILSGTILNGGLPLTGFAGTASVINIHGFVNRITA